MAEGDWAARLDCQLATGGNAVVNCLPGRDSDNQLFMYRSNKPHTAAVLLMAHELDPSLALCTIVKDALDDPDLTDGWQEVVSNDSGWWKGAAQVMQSMVFGVGIYDTCSDER